MATRHGLVHLLIWTGIMRHWWRLRQAERLRAGQVSEIDQQLYAKYGLDTEEIAFIEDNVKPME